MKKRWITVLLILAATAPLPGQSPGRDPLQQHIFPPELVMRNQAALGVDEGQRNYLIEQVQAAQKRFTEVQWQLQEEVEALSQLLSQSQVNEDEALARVDRVLELEAMIKKTHLALAVRIKNSLSEEQQDKLKRLRSAGAR